MSIWNQKQGPLRQFGGWLPDVVHIPPATENPAL